MRSIARWALVMLVLGCGTVSGRPPPAGDAGSGGAQPAGGSGGGDAAGAGPGGSGGGETGGGGAGGEARCGDDVVGLGESCDDGNANGDDGCSPSCTPDAGPGAPAVTRAGYFRLGPGHGSFAVEGTYESGPMAGVQFDFLDAAGDTALADTDFDGTGDSPRLFFPLEPFNSFAGQFHLDLEVTTLVDEVQQIVVTLVDAEGRRSAPFLTPQGARPSRGAGEPCDPNGSFDVCDAGLSCRLDLGLPICG